MNEITVGVGVGQMLPVVNEPDNLNTFCNVTEAEIAELLTPLGFVKTDLPNTAEITFSKVIMYENAPTVVRIYTAVLKDSGQSRPAGKDAIRVCLGRDDGTGTGHVRLFKTITPMVRRIHTWRVHLLDRLVNIGTGVAQVKPQLSEADLLAGRTTPTLPPTLNAADLKCPLCGARMVGPKSSKRGAFFGCSKFPGCRGARNIDGSVDRRF